MIDDKEPDAYGLLDDSGVHYATPFRDEAERVIRRTVDTDSAIVPLYRSPTLTDAEREAIATAMNAYGENNDDAECAQIEETLSKLLERLGGGR